MAASVIGLRHFGQISFIKRSKDGAGAGNVRPPHGKMHFMVTRRTIVDADVRVMFFRQ